MRIADRALSTTMVKCNERLKDICPYELTPTQQKKRWGKEEKESVKYSGWVGPALNGAYLARKHHRATAAIRQTCSSL